MSVEELLYRLRRVSYGLGLIYASLIISIIGGLVLAFLIMSAMSGPIGRAIQKAQKEEEAKQAQMQKDAVKAPPADPKDGVKAPANEQAKAKDRKQNEKGKEAEVAPKGPDKDLELGAEEQRKLTLIFLGFALLMIAVNALGFAGQLICRAVPRESRAAQFLNLSLGLQFLGFAKGAWDVLAAANLLPRFPDIIDREISLVSIGGPVFFMLFLVALGHYIHREDLSRRSKSVLIWSIVAIALGIGGLLLGFAAGGAAGGPPGPPGPPGPEELRSGMILLLAMAIGGVQYLRYIALIRDSRRGVLEYCRAIEFAPPTGEYMSDES